MVNIQQSVNAHVLKIEIIYSYVERVWGALLWVR